MSFKTTSMKLTALFAIFALPTAYHMHGRDWHDFGGDCKITYQDDGVHALVSPFSSRAKAADDVLLQYNPETGQHFGTATVFGNTFELSVADNGPECVLTRPAGARFLFLGDHRVHVPTSYSVFPSRFTQDCPNFQDIEEGAFVLAEQNGQDTQWCLVQG